MTEDFLHYIWKFQKFNTAPLVLEDGHELMVFQTGYHNHNSGPDFELARVKMGNMEWSGSVEIHLKSSDWYRHGHQKDTAYNNVILHIVWEDDQPISIDGNIVPTLVVRGKIDEQIHKKYTEYLQSDSQIPCESYAHQFSDIQIASLKTKMLVERLEQKSQRIAQLLHTTNGDWESTTYTILAENFGFSVNKEPFLALANALPFRILKKYLNDTTQREALLFGQSGFLGDDVDEYHSLLYKEYQYLSKKHQLSPPMNVSMWKFSKIRPANFPTVRLMQFGLVLAKLQHLFDTLIDFKDTKKYLQLLDIEVVGYWSSHYHFGKKQSKITKRIGKATLENVIINTIAPLLTAYGQQMNYEQYATRAIELLEHISPEKNHITKKYIGIFPPLQSAFDSQGIIQLYKNYCASKKCLQCNLGITIFAA